MRVARAPGRINLIGDHTDYNAGFVLPMILDKAVYAAARVGKGTRHRLRSIDFDETLEFEIGIAPRVSSGHWATYVAGMLLELRVDCAMDVLISGEVPLGAGMSSSAAVEMATGLVVSAATSTTVDPVTLARIGQRVEHRHVGVECGLMDQMVSRLGKPNHAFLLDCRSLEYTHVPVRKGAAKLVAINSNIRRALAHSKYNERRSECGRALAIFQQQDHRLDALRDVTENHLAASDPDMDPVLLSRARHVVEENMRVHAAVRALRAEEWSELGALLVSSHESLRDWFEVSCAELDFLVSVSLAVPNTFGARMMGGGFGGCTINMVKQNQAEHLATTVQRSYRKEFGLEADAWVLGEGLEAAVLL